MNVQKYLEIIITLKKNVDDLIKRNDIIFDIGRAQITFKI